MDTEQWIPDYCYNGRPMMRINAYDRVSVFMDKLDRLPEIERRLRDAQDAYQRVLSGPYKKFLADLRVTKRACARKNKDQTTYDILMEAHSDGVSVGHWYIGDNSCENCTAVIEAHSCPIEKLPLMVGDHTPKKAKEIAVKRLAGDESFYVPPRQDLLELYEHCEKRFQHARKVGDICMRILLEYVNRKYTYAIRHHGYYSRAMYVDMILNNKRYLFEYDIHNRDCSPGFRFVYSPEYVTYTEDFDAHRHDSDNLPKEP